MAKPKISIRNPPPAPGVPSLVEEAGFRTPRTSKTPRTFKTAQAVRPPRRNVVQRADGRELRRPTWHTGYGVRAAELDVDVSAALGLAAEAWLQG